ncbi:ABC transporter ATP-binding protein [Tropicimonas sp. IMCC34011]|uniref:ABC transporter ATP-binding protein n=1 Tax=Tropicimonas sp. IMCC34011 TaxID=2248759 RepID=UPI000E253F82|nr:ABC transporter ATP-binding protein [Tropicimonas sp. IMCC34011]
MTGNAIEIDGLTKTYAAVGGEPPKTALDGVDLTVRAGAIFGLLGPNGAGKSTLINILAGLVVKTSGKVRIWGFDQDVNPRQSRASIGVMPQELNMDPFFTPRQSLEVQAGLYGVPKRERRTDEILETIGLTDKASAYARNLSGGMRRRLLLGKALVHRPHVLVLDEPTAGVDIELRKMLWRNVRRLNEEDGMTIILTTHYLEEAQEMCDEIAIVDRGRIVAQDSTQNLVGRLDAKALVVTPQEDTPIGELPGLPEGVEMSRRPAGAVALTYRRGEVTAGQLLDIVRAAGISVADVRSEEPNLEDAFLALTSHADEETSVEAGAA